MKPLTPNQQISVLLDEYREIGNNLRQYGNMRFAQLTLFVGVTGGLLAASFSKDVNLTLCQKISVTFMGLLLTVAFWIMEERSTDWWNRFYSRAVQIEEILGMSQYSQRKKMTIVSATSAVRAVFIVITIIWLSLVATNSAGLYCHA